MKEEIDMRSSKSTLHKAMLVIGVAIEILAFSTARAQEFPVRPLRIVIPYTAGGSTDWLARAVSVPLQQRLKQPVVVENKAGGGGVLGMEDVSRSLPDGHTMVLVTNTVAGVSAFNKGATFDPQKDLVPVSLATRDIFIIAANPAVPAKNLREFVAFAKANPGKLNFAAVTNSMQHLTTAEFIRAIGAQITIVPYPGGAQNTRAILANEVQGVISIYVTVSPHVKAGKLVALAVAGTQRLPLMPDIPTVRESGVDFEASNWVAFFTTPGTPTSVVKTLSNEISTIITRSEVARQLREQGIDPVGSTPEMLAKSLASEVARAREIAQSMGI
jgi:tripartite-type tricarboxylate transporter receptor subunit TctC